MDAPTLATASAPTRSRTSSLSRSSQDASSSPLFHQQVSVATASAAPQSPSAGSLRAPSIASGANMKRRSTIARRTSGDDFGISSLQAVAESVRRSRLYLEPPAASVSVLFTGDTEDANDGGTQKQQAREVPLAPVIEDLIVKYCADPRASVSAALFDCPPPFGARDLSLVIEGVLVALASEMNTSIPSVVSAYVPSMPPPGIQAVRGSQQQQIRPSTASIPMTAAQMGLKIKTLTYTNDELGRKLETSNKQIDTLVSRLATVEGEKTAALLCAERLKQQLTTLETRCLAAESISKLRNGVMEEGHVTERATSENVVLPAKIHSITEKTAVPFSAASAFDVELEPYDDGLDHDRLPAWNQELDPTKITRQVIENTAEMLAEKKKFDPPDDSSTKNPTAVTPPPPHRETPESTTYRATNTVPRLLASHARASRQHHVCNALAAQTQALLRTHTPAEYLRTLHGQLEAATHALHECLDALAEERRVRDAWRAKWEKASWRLRRETARRLRDAEERENERNNGAGGIGGGGLRGRYLVNAVAPLAGVNGAAEILDGVVDSLVKPVAEFAKGTPKIRQRKRLICTAPEPIAKAFATVDASRNFNRPKYQPMEDGITSNAASDEQVKALERSKPRQPVGWDGPTGLAALAASKSQIRTHRSLIAPPFSSPQSGRRWPGTAESRTGGGGGGGKDNWTRHTTPQHCHWETSASVSTTAR
ncbi:hypothetical protein HDU84_004371 [Entophlyctis sp. JEL0112]|nr:hypothetical protein HDU84_004371 [Entophlyctis sp. JEL0112]